MERERDIRPAERIPHIAIPRPHRASPKEIERRRKVYDRVMKLREEMEPLDIPVSELIRRAREEADRRG